MQLNRAEVIRRARGGEAAAWEEILDEHRQGVFRYSYLKLGNAQEAEDVAQETFIRAFQHLDRFDENRPLRPWLLTIAANLSRNRWRDLHRYWNALERFLWKRTDSGFNLHYSDRVESVGANADKDQLWSAIQQLDEKDKDVIYLRYFMELSVAEAAQVMGVAEGTVKSRTYRALERLHEVLQRTSPELVEGVK